MDPKSYHIPDDHKRYSREPRPYTPKPPATSRTPSRAEQRGKSDWRKPVLPAVSKLKPLARYAPATPGSRPPAKESAKTSPSASRAPSVHQSHQHAADQRRREEAQRAEQRRLQDSRSAEQQRVQAQYAQEQQRVQNRHKTDEQRRQAEHQDELREQQERHRRSQKHSSDRDEDAEDTKDDDDDESDQDATDAAESDADHSARGKHRSPRSRDEMKELVRQQLARGKDADDEASDAATDTTSETKEPSKGGCSTAVTWLIVAVVVYFLFCNGCAQEIWAEIKPMVDEFNSGSSEE